MSRNERVDEKLNSLLATLFVYLCIDKILLVVQFKDLAKLNSVLLIISAQMTLCCCSGGTDKNFISPNTDEFFISLQHKNKLLWV